MFKNILNAFINTNEKEVKRLEPLVQEINRFEPTIKELSDTELRHKTEEFKNRLKEGATLDDLLPEAFAVVREAAKRTLHMRHFDVQLMGGIVLHQGRIAEMKTGEGKTLVATLPAYLNALTGEGVHIVTVNEYLAKRDSELMGKIYRFLGLSVGLILSQMEPKDKQAAYNADIVFATNNELGFDYLRDNMSIFKENLVQRKLNYAIIDEVDSILIDEARTPLIISGNAYKADDSYLAANSFIYTLKEEEDYKVDEKAHTAFLTEEGVAKAEAYFKIENLYDPEQQQRAHLINNALKAHTLMKRDKDYVVKDGAVIIVDQFTGRLMLGRQYSDGLHQAIEAKENVQIKKETKTLATITFQNFFRMYQKRSGMTGTAMTEEDEFINIYGMDVVSIPTNKEMKRVDQDDVVYKTENGKFKAIVEEIKESHAKGQPVLVGTITIDKSEELSHLLKKQNIKHQVLNAKYHEKEAEIIAQAGRLGAVTIATNMAGRGTDIMLGGNPDYLALQEMRRMGYTEELVAEANGFAETEDQEIIEARQRFIELRDKYKAEADKEHDQIVLTGGLKVIGSERHESRRIDNQLRGRSGRQGDPGESRFYISLEDDLIRLFGSDNLKNIMGRIGMEEDMPIENKMLTRTIENAQKRVEERNFDTRKHVLEYDMVMNTQREVIYSQRNDVLSGKEMRDTIIDFSKDIITELVEVHTANSKYSEEWDLADLNDNLHNLFLPKSKYIQPGDDLDKQRIIEDLEKTAEELYRFKEREFEQEGYDFREIERIVLLQTIDEKWMDHIDAMHQLKQGIGLRAYGHDDPLVAYKNEGYEMFNYMIDNIKYDVLRTIYHIVPKNKMERKQVAKPLMATGGSEEVKKKPIKKDKKVGRNDLCPCGSGLKYKKCCGKDL